MYMRNEIKLLNLMR